MGHNNTIAGMVSSQCGVPYDANAIPNPGKPVLPNLYCPAENNYNLRYVGGASLEFAGKGNFYTSHSFNNAYWQKPPPNTPTER